MLDEVCESDVLADQLCARDVCAVLFDDNDPAIIERGNDYFWEAAVGRQISSKVTLGLNVKQGNYDFGRTRSAAFVVTIGF